jgi:hypothetical protein
MGLWLRHIRSSAHWPCVVKCFSVWRSWSKSSTRSATVVLMYSSVPTGAPVMTVRSVATAMFLFVRRLVPHCLHGWTAVQQESAFVDAQLHPCELPDESLVVVDVVQESFRVAVNDEVVCECPGPCRRHPRVQRAHVLVGVPLGTRWRRRWSPSGPPCRTPLAPHPRDRHRVEQLRW